MVYFEQTKNTVVFTHLPNKCHNIFTKHLFSVVVGYSFIFYYFILTYKKLTLQWLQKYCKICCVVKQYIKGKKKYKWKKKKTVNSGTVATVGKKKKKKKKEKSSASPKHCYRYNTCTV